MQFSWDPKRARQISRSYDGFYDHFAKITDDPDRSENEDRYILIISARKATRNEKKDFEEV